MTALMGEFRQILMGRLTEALIAHTHERQAMARRAHCPKCKRSLKARRQAFRTVETLVGPVRLKRPYFYCAVCRQGFSPREAALAVAASRHPGEVQKAIATLTAAGPYEAAQELFGALTACQVSAERMHTLTHDLADGLGVWDVAPDRTESVTQIVDLSAGKRCRPVMVVAIDGAHVPTRPDEAGERRDGPKRSRARRARWRGHYREAKGLRLYLLGPDRIVHGLSGPQVQEDDALGGALAQLQAADVIPQDQGRLCVIADGAPWIWKQTKKLFPTARQVLDYSPCAARVHAVAQTRYGQSLQAREGAEATLTRLSHGEVGHVIGGLKHMEPHSNDPAHAVANLIDYLDEHRHRTTYEHLRRGGYPLGSGGIEAANTCICHVRLKRSGAWWYVDSSNRLLALRCATYHGVFDRVFAGYRTRQMLSENTECSQSPRLALLGTSTRGMASLS